SSVYFGSPGFEQALLVCESMYTAILLSVHVKYIFELMSNFLLLFLNSSSSFFLFRFAITYVQSLSFLLLFCIIKLSISSFFLFLLRLRTVALHFFVVCLVRSYKKEYKTSFIVPVPLSYSSMKHLSIKTAVYRQELLNTNDLNNINIFYFYRINDIDVVISQFIYSKYIVFVILDYTFTKAIILQFYF
ncbi:hypothetical protein L9F63_019639, partial [Diploptera punctata]